MSLDYGLGRGFGWVARDRIAHVRRVALFVAAATCFSATAGPIADSWGVVAYDLSTSNAMAYRLTKLGDRSQVKPSISSEEAGPGTTVLQRGGDVSKAEAQYGRVSLFADAFHPYTSSDPSAATRDVWTVTGASGMGVMVVKGHLAATFIGAVASLQASAQVKSLVGDGGQADASFGTTFYLGNGALVITSKSCDAARRSECTASVNGNVGQVDWTLTLPFEYGKRVFAWSSISGAAVDVQPGEGLIPGKSTLDAMSGVTIDSIELPAGAQLSAASGPMYFYDNSWHYTPAVVVGSADVSVTGAVATRPVKVGGVFSVSVTAANSGPSTVTTVLNVPSPGIATMTSVTPASDCSLAATLLQCSFPLPAGTSRTFSLNYTLNAAGSVTISPTVSSNEPDPNSANNSVTLSVKTARPKK